MQLWQPIGVRDMRMANRLVSVPLFSGTAQPDGTPGEKTLEIYEGFARSGVGLVVVEHHAVHAAGRVRKTQLMLHDDAVIEGHRRLTECFRSAGVPALVQLNHGGSLVMDPALWNEEPLPAAPSPVPHPGLEGEAVPRELNESDLSEIVQSFASAALRAMHAGYDGVEVHGAHGFLLGQFLSPLTNHRSDRYGGDIRGRSRLLRDIVDVVRDLIGDAPLSVRLGMADHLPCAEPRGLRIEETAWLAGELVAMGADILDLSGNMCGYDGEGDAYFEPFAREITQHVGMAPTVCAGGIRSAGTAERLLRDGSCRLVGVGRPLLADPTLPERWRQL
ncbi:MAG: NADH:flavin oxidoreductase [Synergistales bacterium]|nr:NADH:flavin oxidoreductase [Synergistales bacterium]